MRVKLQPTLSLRRHRLRHLDSIIRLGFVAQDTLMPAYSRCPQRLFKLSAKVGWA